MQSNCTLWDLRQAQVAVENVIDSRQPSRSIEMFWPISTIANSVLISQSHDMHVTLAPCNNSTGRLRPEGNQPGATASRPLQMHNLHTALCTQKKGGPSGLQSRPHAHMLQTSHKVVHVH